MFSEVEYTYLSNLINTYVLNGEYTHYLAYTNTDLSSTYNYEYPDLYVIFSKEEIIANNNKFTIPEDNIKISINSKSATRNGTNGNRFAFTESNRAVTVPIYEFIYTNATNSKYADVLAKEEYIVKQDLNYNLDKNEFYIMPSLLSVLIVMLFLKWCFPMKGGKKA